MELKHRKDVMIEVDYKVLEEFVNKHYNQEDWSFVADQECGNDSHHTFIVENKPLDEYQQADVDEFKSKGYGFRITGELLQDLCAQGLIEEGKYIVDVCW